MHRLGRLYCLFIATCLLISGVSVSHSQQPSSTDEEHAKWIASVIRTIGAIKPGTTREEMKKILQEEGGISTRTHRTYVYKQCPLIKVTVIFAAADADPSTEKPQDRVVSISRPYLEYSIMD
jgi:hypothetical protein